jgi:hypothetical protein
MKKILMVALCLAIVPMLFAGKKNAMAEQSYDPNSRINTSPATAPVQIDDGRAFGDILMTIDLDALGWPHDGYDNAGLTWDGTYLYILNMYDNNMYIIDPTGPSIVGNFSVPATLCWGLGHEQNLWMSEVLAGSHLAYEYTYAGTPTGNSFYVMQGGASWMGDASEWWADGEIWFLAVGGTNRAYRFTVPGGTYLSDIGDATWTYTSQRGFSYDPFNDQFYVGGWNSDMVWQTDNAGVPTGKQFAINSIASLAYDWQSTFHPTPVLWVATNDAVNVIHMCDADNLQPPPEGYDFETGWQGWTHTNGEVFPAAWGVMASDYKASWQLPESGDSSMWMDSDDNGGGYADTALSPVLVPRPSMDWLKYGISYNFLSSGEWVEVGIKYFDGTSWNIDPLVTYTTDTGPMWDSVDVSAYAGYSLVQVYFYYDDDGMWAWYVAFDNVIIDAFEAEHDVGCASVVSPPAGDLIAAGDYDVIGQIINPGDYLETFDATAHVYDTLDSWNLVFNVTVTLIDFPIGADSNLNFGTVTFEDDKVYYTEIYTELIDANPGNDTSAIYSTTTSYDFVWNFEAGLDGWTHTNGLSFPGGWDIMPANYQGSSWQIPDAGSYSMWIDSDANGSGTILTADTALSPVFLPLPTTLDFMYGVSYNWIASGEWMEVGIKYHDGASWTVVPLMTYTADVTPRWETIDVSAYNTYDSLQIYFYYSDNYIWAWYAAFDNVMINGWDGIAEQPGPEGLSFFGFAPDMASLTKGQPTISYSTTAMGKVSLKIYDNTGRLIRTLVDRTETAGTKTLHWNRMDNNNRRVANGIYFIRLMAEENTATHKLILLK